MIVFLFLLFTFHFSLFTSSLSAFSIFGEGHRELKDITEQADNAFEEKRYHDAVALLEEAGRRYPRKAYVRLNLAHIYRKVGLLDKARGCAMSALKDSRGAQRNAVRRELALIYYHLKLFEYAREVLGNITKKSQFDTILRSRVLMGLGLWEEAHIILESLPDDIDNIDFWRGWCLWKSGKKEDALAQISQAPDNAISRIFNAKTIDKNLNAWGVLAFAAKQAVLGKATDVLNGSTYISGKADKDAIEMIEALKK
ncbi:tetratricopeptide repeat protein [Elusimicrobiota bacterium]